MKCGELFKLLRRDGWYVARQTGSHVMMRHAEKSGQITVPFHASKEVKKGLLTAILKRANIKTDKR